MLKKMRRRFIGAAMAAFSAVIVILQCAVNLWNWHSVVGQLDQTIDMLQSPAPGGAAAPLFPRQAARRPARPVFARGTVYDPLFRGRVRCGRTGAGR